MMPVYSKIACGTPLDHDIHLSPRDLGILGIKLKNRNPGFPLMYVIGFCQTPDKFAPSNHPKMMMPMVPKTETTTSCPEVCRPSAASFVGTASRALSVAADAAALLPPRRPSSPASSVVKVSILSLASAKPTLWCSMSNSV